MSAPPQGRSWVQVLPQHHGISGQASKDLTSLWYELALGYRPRHDPAICLVRREFLQQIKAWRGKFSVFPHDCQVPSTDNISVRKSCPSVVFRKVVNGLLLGFGGQETCLISLRHHDPPNLIDGSFVLV